MARIAILDAQVRKRKARGIEELTQIAETSFHRPSQETKEFITNA
jgi:hypothetical protein